MTKRNAISLLVAAGLTAGCSTAVDKAAENEPKRVLDAQAIEERATAIQAMHEMSTYLRSLQKFSVNADVSFDEVLDNGQKVLLNKAVEINVERPSKLWSRVTTEYSQREFYYDGDMFTIYTPDLGYFASFATPATLGEVVKQAKNDYDIEVPIADLFLWGTTADASGDVDEAIIVGIDKVNGVSCNHFAFREKEIDWQICIQRDGVPLPLKLVITEKGDITQPQHISILTWNTAPDLSGQNYTFTAKQGDQKIAFRKVKMDK